MTQPEHLFNWLKKQTHVKQIAMVEASGIDKAVLSKLLSGKRKPNGDHYKAMLPFAKKIGYLEQGEQKASKPKKTKKIATQPYVDRRGFSSHKVYRLWNAMIARCHRNDVPRYKGRGISVCEAWRNDFFAFYDYVTSLPGYSLENIGLRGGKLTLDRINNDGNYEPGNVRWATPRQQYENSSSFKSKKE